MTNSPESMGIYIHFPFCRKKCSYCDFYSLPITAPGVLNQYTDCLERELTLRTSECDLPLASSYLGGGTPSLLPPQDIERVIAAINRDYPPSGEREVTIEVNPATVDRQKLADLQRAGVNRLSIGVQSFVDRELTILGRVHDSRQGHQCIDWAQQAGFTNVNLDLIYGIPGQRRSDWLATLTRAMDCGPQHISAYLLQLEPDVPLAREIATGQQAMLTDDQEADLYYEGRALLLSRGYQHYELSNFAHPGFQCRHNLTYWRGGRYLGVGVGAVSFDGRQRHLNSPPLEDYMAALLNGTPPPRQLLETLTAEQERAEAFIIGLRLTQGIDREEYCSRFGADALGPFQDAVNRLAAQGLLVVDDRRIALSPRAYFISNVVFREFVD
ncbi:MAG: radical SAM family heme chaperone HemW [Syntrophomonas sp.]|nr:radical SAM family heme chaperone HemW [Syntrophomonas sp.]